MAENPSLKNYVTKKLPSWKQRFNLSENVSEKLICSIAEESISSIEECEIFSLEEELSQEISINQEFIDTQPKLSSRDVKALKPLIIEAISNHREIL